MSEDEEASVGEEDEKEEYWRLRIPKPSILFEKAKDIGERAREMISSKEEKRCANCGKSLSAEYKICPYCATPVTEEKRQDTGQKRTCPECGKSISTDFTICPYCGKKTESKLPTPKPAPPSTISIFCRECGAELTSDFQWCPKCGTKLGAKPQKTKKEPVKKKKVIEDKKPASTEVQSIKTVAESKTQSTSPESLKDDSLAPVIMEQFMKLVKSGKIDQSLTNDLIKKQKKTIEENPNSKEAMKSYYNLGIIHSNLSQHMEAIDYYDKAINLNESLTNAEWSGPWWDMGQSYYALNNFVKAGECYYKAYEIDPSVSGKYVHAMAYLIIKFREDKGAKLYRLRPGVAVAIIKGDWDNLERGEEKDLVLSLYNGSKKKATVTVKPDFPKEVRSEETRSFSVELLPGQFYGRLIPVQATLKTPVKEYEPAFELTSEAMKYRAADKGIEMASDIASELIPFSGVLVSWLGAKGLKNKLTLGLPIKVVKPIPKWFIGMGSDTKSVKKLQLLNAWGTTKDTKTSIEANSFMDNLAERIDEYTHYNIYPELQEAIYVDSDLKKKDFAKEGYNILALYARFKEDTTSKFKGQTCAFLLMEMGDNKMGIMAIDKGLVGVLREDCKKKLNEIIEKPEFLNIVEVYLSPSQMKE